MHMHTTQINKLLTKMEISLANLLLLFLQYFHAEISNWNVLCLVCTENWNTAIILCFQHICGFFLATLFNAYKHFNMAS